MMKRLPILNIPGWRWPKFGFSSSAPRGRGRWLLGAALIGAGLLALVSQFADASLFGLLFLPILGMVFLIWGIGTHHEGLLVSGSVISGMGIGVLLIERVLTPLSTQSRSGVFLLAVAGGWAAVSLLTAVLRLELRWWPLLPAGVLALVGTALLLGGAVAQALVLLGQLWPAALIIVGLVVLFRRGQEGSRKTIASGPPTVHEPGETSIQPTVIKAETSVQPDPSKADQDGNQDAAPTPRAAGDEQRSGATAR